MWEARLPQLGRRPRNQGENLGPGRWPHNSPLLYVPVRGYPLDSHARTNLRNQLTRTITVYTQIHCQPCKATKRWLDKRDIPYTEVDISTSPDDAKAILALGFKEAPVIIV